MEFIFVPSYSYEVNTINHKQGQFIYCQDTGVCYFDINNRGRLTNFDDNVLIYETKKELNDIENDTTVNKFFNRAYICIEENKVYQYDYDISKFTEITEDTQFIDIINRSIEMVPGTLTKDGKAIAPMTSIYNVVSAEDGRTTAAEMLDDELKITTTCCKFVEATKDNQRVFKIPFPTNGYSLYRDHMIVIRRNRPLTGNQYTVNGPYIILSEEMEGLNINEKLLFTFYYTKVVSMSQGATIGTNNIIDGAITIEKLDPDIMIGISHIYEEDGVDKHFMTDKQIEKLDGIEEHANNYIHPDTHPADMIEETEQRLWYTPDERDKLNGIEENANNYIHPDHHHANVIIFKGPEGTYDGTGLDLEQYSRILDESIASKRSYCDGVSNSILSLITIPGTYRIESLTTDSPSTTGYTGLIEVNTSTGREFNNAEGEVIFQKFIADDGYVYTRTRVGGTNSEYTEWVTILSTKDANGLLTENKDIIGAINEVFTLANNGRAKWHEVIGYPTDEFDSFTNLYIKTQLLKDKFAEKLRNKGILSADGQDTLENLINHIDEL